jgi:hypothetical protein
VTGNEKAERDRAWAAFSANLVVLPGLGSLLMGRRSGWLQAPLALAGLSLSVRWVVLVLLDWRRAGALPDTVPRAGLLLEGVALFALAWLWALATGLAMLRRLRAGAAAEQETP